MVDEVKFYAWSCGDHDADLVTWENRAPKDWQVQYCPLVMQGFSNVLGLCQVIMANCVMLVMLPTLEKLGERA